MDRDIEVSGVLAETSKPSGLGLRSGSQARRRVQVDFSPDGMARLQELKAMVGAGSNAQVIRTAVRIYECLLKHQESDYNLQLVKGNSVKELVMF